MQRCQFVGHVIGRALCLFGDPTLPAFEGRGPVKTSILDDLPRLDRGKATEDDLHAVGGGVELDVVPRSDDIGGEIVGGALRLVFAARVIEYLPPVGHCRQRGRAGLCDAITDLFGPLAGGVKVRAVIASMRVMVALLFCRADLRRRRSVVWLAVAASPVDGHIIAQTAEAVGKSAALQKSPYGAFLKIFSTQARTLRAHSMKQSLWDCFYSARVIK